LLLCREPAKLSADAFRGVDDQRLQLSDCFRAGQDRALPSREQDADRLALAAPPWLGEVFASERLTGGAGGIELI